MCRAGFLHYTLEMIDFSAYAPQRMFLIQGTDADFDAMVGELAARDPLTQALSVPRFTIEHARMVSAFASEGDGADRTMVVAFSVFSPEAAQVLLKSLEEPADGISIIFITRYPYLVPRTVRSRLMLLHRQELPRVNLRTTASVLEEIKKEAAEKDDEAALRRSRAVALLDELEQVVRQHPRAADTIYRAKAMLFSANLPTKYILDYVSTVIR